MRQTGRLMWQKLVVVAGARQMDAFNGGQRPRLRRHDHNWQFSAQLLSRGLAKGNTCVVNKQCRGDWECYNLKGEESQIRNSHNKQKNTVFNNF